MKTMWFVVQRVVLLWLLGMFACGARAGVLTTLHIFNVTDGQYPQATLAPGTDGSFYGTTYYGGGAGGSGAIFKVTTNGAFTPVASFGFTNGANPLGRLLPSGDVFFGTTANGGPFNHGTVFQLTSSNTITMQLSFTNSAIDGTSPASGLISDISGILYGTTLASGPSGYGTVFKMNKTDTKPTTMVSFNAFGVPSNGGNPESGLLLRDNGWFYGTTSIGGSNNAGVVFKMSSSGVVSNLFSFGSTNGAYPWAGLVKGPDDALYGTTTQGGVGNYGTVFKVTTNDVVELVAAFGNTNGASPIAELTPAPDGNLYGVARFGGASGYGTLFKVTTNGTIESLFTFNYSKGAYPYGGMVFGPDGHLYGTTVDGGSGSGTIFRFIVNPPAPVMQSVIVTNGNTALTWSAVTGGDYQLQFKTNLLQANWSNLGFAITATNSSIVAIDTAPPDAQRFYRAVLLQP